MHKLTVGNKQIKYSLSILSLGQSVMMMTIKTVLSAPSTRPMLRNI